MYSTRGICGNDGRVNHSFAFAMLAEPWVASVLVGRCLRGLAVTVRLRQG
jgi:hypothetical protein